MSTRLGVILIRLEQSEIIRQFTVAGATFLSISHQQWVNLTALYSVTNCRLMIKILFNYDMANLCFKRSNECVQVWLKHTITVAVQKDNHEKQ